MKKLACAIAVAGLIGTPAFAADMPVKAPAAPIPAPVYNWTGWYVGGNIGYSWGRASNNLAFSQSAFGSNFVAFSTTDTPKVDGVIGGLQAGFNWQVSNFLYGIETDFQGSGQKGTNNFGSLIINLGGPQTNSGNNPATVTETTKLDWFGTTRGRVGFVSDRWLVYGTGGIAYGRINQTGGIQPANPIPTAFNAPIVWNGSSTKVGWVVGAGVENAITGKWTWKFEYLYVDLGTASANVSGGVGNVTTTGAANCYGTVGGGGCQLFPNPATGTVTSHLTDNILRVGLNYKFN